MSPVSRDIGVYCSFNLCFVCKPYLLISYFSKYVMNIYIHVLFITLTSTFKIFHFKIVSLSKSCLWNCLGLLWRKWRYYFLWVYLMCLNAGMLHLRLGQWMSYWYHIDRMYFSLWYDIFFNKYLIKLFSNVILEPSLQYQHQFVQLGICWPISHTPPSRLCYHCHIVCECPI